MYCSPPSVCTHVACSKRRKVDEENCCYKDEWIDKFLFILPSGSSKPVCLICSKNLEEILIIRFQWLLIEYHWSTGINVKQHIQAAWTEKGNMKKMVFIMDWPCRLCVHRHTHLMCHLSHSVRSVSPALHGGKKNSCSDEAHELISSHQWWWYRLQRLCAVRHAVIEEWCINILFVYNPCVPVCSASGSSKTHAM